MRDVKLKHKNNNKNRLDTPSDEAGKWVCTDEGIEAFENIKAVGRKEIEEGRADSPISRFIKLFVEQMEKA